MKIDTFTTIIALSGQTGSGKTSLAKELVQRLDANFASFGSFVRREAIHRGIQLDRLSLQNLGQALIREFGSDKFVKAVLTQGQGNSSTLTILDGVRSVEIWHSVQKLASRSILVYLDIEEGKCIERLIRRDKLDLTLIRLAMSHPMEMNVSELLTYADLVLHTGSIEAMLLDVMSIFKNKILV
jgi:cytidylate kinase